MHGVERRSLGLRPSQIKGKSGARSSLKETHRKADTTWVSLSGPHKPTARWAVQRLTSCALLRHLK